LNRALGTVEVGTHDATLVLGRTVPEDQQPSLELRAQGLQELHDLLALDRAVKRTPYKRSMTARIRLSVQSSACRPSLGRSARRGGEARRLRQPERELKVPSTSFPAACV
jgi:hypothetical protein